MAGTTPSSSSLLDVVGDSTNRQILLIANGDPVTAKELAARLDITPPTVYRRTDQLVDHDLLAVSWRVDADGNHYRTFETGLRRIEIELTADRYTIELQLRRSLTDAFSGLWTDLEQPDPDWGIGSSGTDRRRSHNDSPST